MGRKRMLHLLGNTLTKASCWSRCKRDAEADGAPGSCGTSKDLPNELAQVGRD